MVKVSNDYLNEFRDSWLPHATDSGLDRLIDLLESESPLLIHGSFVRVIPMGCLASHLGWHHPMTEHLQEEAGICWLTKVAGLNPATSSMVLKWDRYGLTDRRLRYALLEECRAERSRRTYEGWADRALCCAAE